MRAYTDALARLGLRRKDRHPDPTVEREREAFEMGFLEGLEAREPWRQWTDAEIRAISVRRFP
jgi:hypothetical protein